MYTSVGCLQPAYLPWIPFFERFLTSDYFVLLDDVDYWKHKYQNRSNIKINNNKNLLTVPVHYKIKVPINQIKIDNSKNWKKKHYQSIAQTYNKSKFFSNFRDDLEKIYKEEWFSLFDLNLELLNFFKCYDFFWMFRHTCNNRLVRLKNFKIKSTKLKITSKA